MKREKEEERERERERERIRKRKDREGGFKQKTLLDGSPERPETAEL